MKILLALFFGISLLGSGSEEHTLDENIILDHYSTQETDVFEEFCRLTITGYGNFAGGRVKLTFSAEAETCEEAAEEMRAEIIKREIRIAY